MENQGYFSRMTSLLARCAVSLSSITRLLIPGSIRFLQRIRNLIIPTLVSVKASCLPIHPRGPPENCSETICSSLLVSSFWVSHLQGLNERGSLNIWGLWKMPELKKFKQVPFLRRISLIMQSYQSLLENPPSATANTLDASHITQSKQVIFLMFSLVMSWSDRMCLAISALSSQSTCLCQWINSSSIERQFEVVSVPATTKVLISSTRSSSVIYQFVFQLFFSFYISQNTSSTMVLAPFLQSCFASFDFSRSFLTNTLRTSSISFLCAKYSRYSFLSPSFRQLSPKIMMGRSRDSTTLLSIKTTISSCRLLPLSFSVSSCGPRKPIITTFEVYLEMSSQRSSLTSPACLFQGLTAQQSSSNFQNILSMVRIMLGIWELMKSQVKTLERILLRCFHTSFSMKARPFLVIKITSLKTISTLGSIHCRSLSKQALMSFQLRKVISGLLNALETTKSQLSLQTCLPVQLKSFFSLRLLKKSSQNGRVCTWQGYVQTLQPCA